VPPIPIGSPQSFVPAGHPGGTSPPSVLPHAASGASPAQPCAASGASPALPRAASGASPTLPRAAPGAPSTTTVSPLRAPVIPPGFSPLSVHAQDFRHVFAR
jgi:hypothetical protein